MPPHVFPMGDNISLRLTCFSTDEGASSAKKAMFSFTGSASGPTPATPTDPFKFGATLAATTTTAPSSSLFTFSANKSTAAVPAPSGGVFGAPPTTTSAPSFAAREYQQLFNLSSNNYFPLVKLREGNVFSLSVQDTCSNLFTI